MGEVCVPHFGVHLDEEVFQNVKKRIEASDIDYLDKPYRRFKGTEFEQETFFVEDPNGNVLEIKTVQIAPFRTLMTALKDILLESNITFTNEGIKLINMDSMRLLGKMIYSLTELGSYNN